MFNKDFVLFTTILLLFLLLFVSLEIIMMAMKISIDFTFIRFYFGLQIFFIVLWFNIKSFYDVITNFILDFITFFNSLSSIKKTYIQFHQKVLHINSFWTALQIIAWLFHHHCNQESISHVLFKKKPCQLLLFYQYLHCLC